MAENDVTLPKAPSMRVDGKCALVTGAGRGIGFACAAALKFREWVEAKIQLRRVGQPKDIMGPIVFLASDTSSLITGTSLMVDGGWTAE